MNTQKAKGNPTNLIFYLLPFYFFLFSGLFSCSQISESLFSRSALQNVSVRKISAIKNQKQVNSTVYLKGNVGNQASFVRGGAYELQDTTGSIWILTKQPLPQKGDELIIEGKLQYQSMPLIFAAGGKAVGELYVQEQQQLEHKSVKNGLLPLSLEKR
ncbi:MAG TPA: hypothetical protein V6D15_05880 [Oculatellaceae cyanobacterium]|jgi:hypothetical protein